MPRSYDDDDDVPVRKRELSGLDGMFANTSFPILILFGLCCGLIALIISIIGVATCKDPVAKKNAMTVMIISLIMTVLGAGIQVVNLMSSGPRQF